MRKPEKNQTSIFLKRMKNRSFEYKGTEELSTNKLTSLVPSFMVRVTLTILIEDIVLEGNFFDRFHF